MQGGTQCTTPPPTVCEHDIVRRQPHDKVLLVFLVGVPETNSDRGEGEGGEVANWATSTCTMTDGKQAAWSTLPSSAENDGNGEEDTNNGDTTTTGSPSPSPPAATLTGSDLVRGGDAPVLLASDSLGRVGLLRYPAKLPPEMVPPGDADAAGAAAPSAEESAGGEEKAADPDASPPPSSEEVEAAAAAAAAVMAEAVEAAVPRVRSLLHCLT